MTRHYTTNLRCAGCLGAIAPHLDADPAVKRWSVDLESAGKTLTVEGAADRARVAELLGRAGYEVTAEVAAPPAAPAPAEPEPSYYPLLLVVGYITGVVALVEVAAGGFHWERAMTNFMAGFFLVFSFFKLLNLSAFADSYAMYDLVAARSRAYALAYPFVELALGAAYVVRFQPFWTNVVTLVVMLVGTAGVVRTLFQRRKVRCACLGSVINLPMSFVTLTEDLLMAVMAAVMLAAGH